MGVHANNEPVGVLVFRGGKNRMGETAQADTSTFVHGSGRLVYCYYLDLALNCKTSGSYYEATKENGVYQCNNWHNV